MEQQRLENLNLIKDSHVRGNLNYLVEDMEDVFTENRMKHGMIFRFFQDCLNGQILICLDKRPNHYINKLSDFYIDDRVGFRGMRRVRKIIESIRAELMKITKQHPPKINIGDVIRPIPNPPNAILRDRLEKNPHLKLKIVSMERGLDPHYTGYHAVEWDEKPFKKNWIYVGSQDIVKEEDAE